MPERLVLTACKLNQFKTAFHTEKHGRGRHVWRQHFDLHAAQINMATKDENTDLTVLKKPTAEQIFVGF